MLRNNLEKSNFPISNGIGVGILSYNRANSLRRLINSIVNHTDLRGTTIFVSDDGSGDPATLPLLEQISHNVVVLKNPEQIGIAGNTNRLLRCLSRFKYGLILNDDVEVLRKGWEGFYFKHMQRSGLHHFLYREVGVYGAKKGDRADVNGVPLWKVMDKPHGAVMAFTNKMLKKVGFFDERFGLYGMEHVDWSQRAWELGLQQPGFYDVDKSDQFFKLHSDTCALAGRTQHLTEARKKFADRKPSYVKPSDRTRVPELAFVVPFRNVDRADAIITVMNNIRAQRFPVVQIVATEHDSASKVDLSLFEPIDHYLLSCVPNQLFNKSKIFNLGVSKVTAPIVVLHDADMLVQGHYAQRVANTLKNCESCHLGGAVMYANKASSDLINTSGIVDNNIVCDRVVGYFEGGSLACKTPIFWRVGGLNEDYNGYGCEDCDFYARLSGGSKWVEDRVFDFLHLWHGRVDGWNQHHEKNKKLENELKRKTINTRIALQHRQLRAAGYAAQLDRLKGK